MHGGPKLTYTKAEAAKFDKIARLPYDAKRVAIDRLTPQERTKYNHFFENLSSDFNESLEPPVRSRYDSIALDALIEEDSENTEDEENDALSSTQTLIYSATRPIKATTTETNLVVSDKASDAHLQSLLENFDLDSDSSEEEVNRKKALP